RPDQVLMVIDAMTGQDAVTAAVAFAERVDFDGVIITKLDGDARGGAALSVRAVTGKPIKFVGVGEKLDALEPFHPDRMAQRILGMGDVVSLIERAQETVNAEDAAALEERMRASDFTLDDFLSQLQQVRKMGSLKDMLGMIPGMGAAQRAQLADAQVDEKALDRTQAIIQSMNAKERRKPAIINGHRRVRIAAGSGTSVQEVNRLLEQFTQARKMMKQMGNMKGGGRGKGRLPF
ncbi:MAG TPA: signal recognition particle protein, partial [Coriobacteriia bacterium]